MYYFGAIHRATTILASSSGVEMNRNTEDSGDSCHIHTCSILRGFVCHVAIHAPACSRVLVCLVLGLLLVLLQFLLLFSGHVALQSYNKDQHTFNHDTKIDNARICVSRTSLWTPSCAGSVLKTATLRKGGFRQGSSCEGSHHSQIYSHFTVGQRQY